jgi:hypothetical protein
MCGFAAEPFSRGHPIATAFVASQLGIFSATPSGNGLSPILKAVPNCDISQDETFSFEIPSFLAVSNASAWP